jgi:hypothetical protein
MGKLVLHKLVQGDEDILIHEFCQSYVGCYEITNVFH